MSIEGRYRAFCFDAAVMTFGSAVEQAIEKATAKCKTEKSRAAKTEQTLAKWLGLPVRYREPPRVAASRPAHKTAPPAKG